MNLFKFLNPKHTILQQEAHIPSASQETDISKTYLIVELFKIPKAQRDSQWYHDFYYHVSTASFACGRPQILIGPDGVPYFILRTPEVDQPFESFCIENMKDDFLVDKGWGVVFNPRADDTADWVFTHGDIVNLMLHNRFFSEVEDADSDNIVFTKM